MYTAYYNNNNSQYELKLNIGTDNYIYIQFIDGTLYSGRFDTSLKINQNLYKNIELINVFITTLMKHNIDIINTKIQEISDHVTWDHVTFPKYTTCDICNTFMTICLYVHDKNICTNCISPEKNLIVQENIFSKTQRICFVFCNICQTVHLCTKRIPINNICPYCVVPNCKLMYNDKFIYCGSCSGLY